MPFNFAVCDVVKRSWATRKNAARSNLLYWWNFYWPLEEVTWLIQTTVGFFVNKWQIRIMWTENLQWSKAGQTSVSLKWCLCTDVYNLTVESASLLFSSLSFSPRPSLLLVDLSSPGCHKSLFSYSPSLCFMLIRNKTHWIYGSVIFRPQVLYGNHLIMWSFMFYLSEKLLSGWNGS